VPGPSIKDQVLQVSQDYLGPAAERFIDRQISTHLNKKSDKITSNDLLKLIDWLKLSFTLLTKDTGIVDEYIQRLTLIARGKGDEAAGGQWSPK
jgi:hypothetical protein